MINNYPNILGIKLGMTFEEINSVMTNLGFNTLVKDPREFGDGYLVNSKIDDSEIFWLQFTNDWRLYNIHIDNWKEAFGFCFDEFSFSNIFEIFSNYFLKGFEYIITRGEVTTLLTNTEWNIAFIDDDILGECITYSKNE